MCHGKSLLLLIVALLALNGCSFSLSQPANPPAPTAITSPRVIATLATLPSEFTAALAPQSSDALTAQAAAPYYQIEAQFDPQARIISGFQTVRMINTEDVPLNDIYFRLYANAPHYNEGQIEVTMVSVDGQPTTTALEQDDTALQIKLPQPITMGQHIEVRMRFATTVPTSGGGYGIFNFSDGVFTLYNWHPELAVYEHGGWILHPVLPIGDPTNIDVANYQVTLSAPPGYMLITSGVEAAPTIAEGQATWRIISALTRNFVIVASDRFAELTRPVGDTVVNSYYLPGNREGAQDALDIAARSLEVFSTQFGPYIYPELDVVEVNLGGGAAGMESTAMIMIGSTYYRTGAANTLRDDASGQGLTFLDFVTIHEVAHQWWYSMVGSDAYLQPWLDESLTNWSSVFAAGQIFGADVETRARDAFLRQSYLSLLERGDIRLDQPVNRFTLGEYGAIVYGKGALMYEALRRQIGDEAFFTFLKRYYDQYRFARVDGASWRATLAEVVGEDVAGAFYRKWVEGSSITETDLPN